MTTTAIFFPVSIAVPVVEGTIGVAPDDSVAAVDSFSTKHGPAGVGGVRDVSAEAVFDGGLIARSVLDESLAS